MHRQATTTCNKEGLTLLRNCSNHANSIQINEVSSTGVLSNCIFNELKYFHVTEKFSVDIMHDVLEGTFNNEISLILKVLIYEKKYFTLETLNCRINYFDFASYENINKPQEISEAHLKLAQKIRYSAAEMMWMMRYLPILISDLILKRMNTGNFLF